MLYNQEVWFLDTPDTRPFVAPPKATKSSPAKMLRLFTIAASVLTSSFATPVPKPPAPPPQHINMGGYIEDHVSGQNVSPWPKLMAKRDRERYLRDAAVLTKAIEACHLNPQTCHPRLKGFIDMVDRVKQIPDRLKQAEIVNAYFNMMEYDKAETYTSASNLDHRTLINALENFKGVCDETARLKYFTMLMLGVDEHNAQYVAEGVFKGETLIDHHAVIAIRIDGRIWVMNLVANYEGKNTVTIDRLKEATLEQSKLESDSLHINLSGQSYFLHTKKPHFMPLYQFNTQNSSTYIYDRTQTRGIVLKSLKAINERVQLAPNVLSDEDIVRMMEPVLAPRYTIIVPPKKPESLWTRLTSSLNLN